MMHRLLTLHCLSPLHCGTGQGIAGIDLPVQRERHTGWPVIPGSSIKGVLRDAFRGDIGGDKADTDPRTTALFGPNSDEVGLGLGALILSDGILLAFPVRSLVGVFAWVTCPMALGRIARLQGGEELKSLATMVLSDDDILCNLCNGDGLVTEAGHVVLEDHALTRKDLPNDLITALEHHWIPSSKDMLPKRLAVVSDTVFTWFANHATQVEARVALDPLTKTVSEGPFFEETVPPESIFIVPIAAEDARHPKADPGLKPASAAMARLEQLIAVKGQLQFGGKATIGRGLCALRFGGK